MKEKSFFSSFSSFSSLIHLVTQKESGKEYFNSLALHTDENPQKILENRATIASKFPNMQFVVAHQTHSANIEIVEKKETKGWREQSSTIQNCDALISNQRGVMLTILTADCVPILLFDKKQNIIGAVHAGWRGTEQEIVAKTVNKMQTEFDSNPKDILVGIAPSIGSCCYEVGEDVAKHFFDYPQALTQQGEKFMLDLPKINQAQLLKVGVLIENIEMSNVCTSCEVENYFSYRKEQGCSGRFMSMIGLS